MKSLNFSKETNIAALVFFAFYFIYGLMRIPFVQFLVSIAAAAIIYGITDHYELAAIALLLTHFAFMTRVNRWLDVSGNSINEGFMSGDLGGIMKRAKAARNPQIQGVGSKMTEGFEDAAAEEMTLADKKESFNSENAVAESKPAPAPKKAAAGSPDEKKGLFKLGEIPEDMKGGLHIDAGTTVMNALNSLKPDQIAEMTKDTKQLIETQKSLMNMLQTVAPMVNEGKQMMDTFNTMFAPSAGAAPPR
jgi:hypothetical protein